MRRASQFHILKSSHYFFLLAPGMRRAAPVKLFAPRPKSANRFGSRRALDPLLPEFKAVHRAVPAAEFRTSSESWIKPKSKLDQPRLKSSLKSSDHVRAGEAKGCLCGNCLNLEFSSMPRAHRAVCTTGSVAIRTRRRAGMTEPLERTRVAECRRVGDTNF